LQDNYHSKIWTYWTANTLTNCNSSLQTHAVVGLISKRWILYLTINFKHEGNESSRVRRTVLQNALKLGFHALQLHRKSHWFTNILHSSLRSLHCGSHLKDWMQMLENKKMLITWSTFTLKRVINWTANNRVWNIHPQHSIFLQSAGKTSLQQCS